MARSVQAVTFTDLKRRGQGWEWARSVPDHRTPQPVLLLGGARPWGGEEAQFQPGQDCPVCHGSIRDPDHYCLVCNDWGRLRGQHPAQAPPPSETTDDGLAGGVGRKAAQRRASRAKIA